uniref:ABC transporter ATP-binding protein n=1 Tax=Aliarcobacter sp. TaxID=2321116 RepID=UPI00404735A8
MSEENNMDALITDNLLLQAKNLSHKFDYELFKDINLSLYKKESIAIIGMSGSGKSTLLNVLSSLLKPSVGKVVFKSKDIYSLKQKELLKIRRDDFGIIFQAHYLFRGFSAIENLEIATLLSGEDIDKNLLKELKIEHVINQGVGELSGGQQQRLSIARVMTKKPRIIFADEPTGNLDKETANIVMDTLFNYINKNDAGLILVTHENELANRCDKVYKLEDLELQEIK